MKYLWISLLICSCQTGIKFDPNWYAGDYNRQSITSRKGHEIFTDEPEFDRFACMHETKIAELAEILERAKIPKEEIESWGIYETIMKLKYPFIWPD